jgi:hypothetical protein
MKRMEWGSVLLARASAWGVAACDGELSRCCDTDPMAQFVRYLVGVVWMISGALAAFSPAPHDAPSAGKFPAVGAVIMLGGIGYVVAAQRNAPFSAWPYKRGPVAGRLSAAIGVLTFSAGALVLWSGPSSGQLSVVALGCALVGVPVLLVVNAVVGPPGQSISSDQKPTVGRGRQRRSVRSTPAPKPNS